MKNLCQVSEYTPDTLILNISFPQQTGTVILKGGQGVLLRGSVIGKNSEGHFELANLAEDIKPDSILADDIDTGEAGTTKNIVAIAYVSGSFNRNALIFGGNDTADTHADALREKGIYLGIAR